MGILLYDDGAEEAAKETMPTRGRRNEGMETNMGKINAKKNLKSDGPDRFDLKDCKSFVVVVLSFS